VRPERAAPDLKYSKSPFIFSKTPASLGLLFDEGNGGELMLRLDEQDLLPRWDDQDPL